MIDQGDELIRTWMSGVLDSVEVSLEPPADDKEGEGATAYLLDLVDAPAARGPHRTPLQVGLRYLVTTWAADEARGHALLGELLFAAMDDPDFEVELKPVDAATWSAIGARPRPHFFVRVPLRKARPEHPAKRVEHPLVIKDSPVRPLDGVVLGPNDTPISSAFLEIPLLQLYANTDTRGRFRFEGVPADPPVSNIIVSARGGRYSVVPDYADGDQVTIRLDLAEE